MTRTKTRCRVASSLLALAFAGSAPTALAFEESRADVRDFIARMHADHDFDEKILREILGKAESQASILKAISRPAEKSKPWHEYRKIFVNEQRIKAGARFWKKHAHELKVASQASGVPQEIMVAIIGVETSYGRITGRYRVVDSLSTLAFDYPPRSDFFTTELENFFLLSREENVDLSTVKGSYAGAMGAAQFMPSSYRLYAADGDADGARDLWDNWEDVFASVANYFVAHGWRTGEEIVARARVDENTAELLASTILTPAYRVAFLREQGVRFATDMPDDSVATLIPYAGRRGTEYWVGFRNFYVITRYNRSRLYALSVLQLGEEIRDRVRR